MQISNNVKWIGNWVGMPMAVCATWFATALATAVCLHKFFNRLIRSHQVDKSTAKKIGSITVICVSTFLTVGVLPRILPFTKVSYGVVPHWNWSWIEARLPNR